MRTKWVCIAALAAVTVTWTSARHAQAEDETASYARFVSLANELLRSPVGTLPDYCDALGGALDRERRHNYETCTLDRGAAITLSVESVRGVVKGTALGFESMIHAKGLLAGATSVNGPPEYNKETNSVYWKLGGAMAFANNHDDTPKYVVLAD